MTDKSYTTTLSKVAAKWHPKTNLGEIHVMTQRNLLRLSR